MHSLKLYCTSSVDYCSFNLLNTYLPLNLSRIFLLFSPTSPPPNSFIDSHDKTFVGKQVSSFVPNEGGILVYS